MVELLKDLMAQFVRTDVLKNADTAEKLLMIDYKNTQYQIEDGMLPIGNARTTAEGLKDGDKRLFYLSVRSFYMEVTKRLKESLPLRCEILADLKFIDPSQRRELSCVDSVRRLAEQFTKLDSCIDVDMVEAEWQIYALEDFSEVEDNPNIDEFWEVVRQKKTVGGEVKYPNLTAMMRIATSFCHGNADTERSFSTSALILTKQRNHLQTEMLNGLLTIKDALAYAGQSSASIEISENLKSYGRNAYPSYLKRQQLEKENEIKEAKRLQKEQEEKEFAKRLREVAEEQKKKHSLAEKMKRLEADKEKSHSNVFLNIHDV